MADNVGRHASTRWVKASVPSYGDEWGDDYDYNYSSEEDSSNAAPKIEAPSGKEEHTHESHIPQEEEVSAQKHSESAPETSNPTTDKPDLQKVLPAGAKNPSNLVLSIDRFKNRSDSDSEDTSDEELVDQSTAARKNTVRKPPSDIDPSLAQSHSPNVSRSVDDFAPPTPTYNQTFASNPETPNSDRSYQSDADSIQNEPVNLNVVDSGRFTSPSNYDSNYEGRSILDDLHEKNLSTINESNQDKHSDYDTDRTASPKPEASSPSPKVATTPLVLSIDKKDFSYSSSDEDDDEDEYKNDHDSYEKTNYEETEFPNYDHDTESDDWGYNSEHSSNNEAEAVESSAKPADKAISGDALKDGDFHQHNQSSDRSSRRLIETAALDSLIHDLENASYGREVSPIRDQAPHEDNDYTLHLDSFNTSLPDFDNSDLINTSLAQEYVDEDALNSPTTPIAPLSLSEEKEGHENYLKESGHRRSIRKPPPSRANLVSVDYSNIADAVSGYMNDNESIGVGSKNLESIGEDNSSIASDPKESSIKQKETIAEDPIQEELYGSELLKRPEATDLHPVVSLDSLSTGRFSFETRSTVQRGDNQSVRDNHSFRDNQSIRDNQPFSDNQSVRDHQSIRDNSSIKDNFSIAESVEPDRSRRVSTMSTTTVNMGGWAPNTNNYRDQFINDNDNESQINFNPHADEPSNYNKFTKVRTTSGLSEVVSNSSSLSVPDTIDAALPQIEEDPDDHDIEQGDNETDAYSFATSHNATSSIFPQDNHLQPKVSAMTTDSILQDHSYPQALFKEERLTPAASKEALPKATNQRYSSLFSAADSESQETKRAASESSTTISGDMPSSKESNPSRVASGATANTLNTANTESTLATKPYTPKSYPVFDWKTIMSASQPIDRIRLLKEALVKETEYDTGLQNWLHETLKRSDDPSNMHIGKIATEAYSNATHNDIRRHASLRSKVSIVKDKVETSGLHATSFGKRFLSRGKKFMKGGD